MWAVSETFLQTLKGSLQTRTVCTITPPTGDAITASVETGGIRVDGGSRIRRTGTLTIEGDTTVFETAATPGAIFSITHGLVYGASEELVPVFYGEAITPVQNFGGGTISLNLVDMSQRLSRCRFLAPYSPSSASTRVAVITAVVQTAIPTATVSNLSSDTGTIGSAQVWYDGPLDVISQLTKDGNTEAFFGPDGTFIIRDQPTTATTSVWSASAGEGGVVEALARTRPLDRLYNTVVVRPSATDGSQTWTQQTAAVTDTTNPRHPNYIGTVPYFYASPTIATAADALTVATQILSRVLGTTETLSVQTIANPALEANDVIRVTSPTINTDTAKTFQHFVDSINFDFTSGSMNLDTRSQLVGDD